MRRRTASALPAFAVVLAGGLAVGGCATSAATAASSSSSAPAPAYASASASTHVYGPVGPDAACADALKAEQTLQAKQGKDQSSESALDQDFTNFADALSNDAGKETRPAAAKAMTALSSDYNNLVQSQSGAAQLPDMNTVENDGTAFEKACA